MTNGFSHVTALLVCIALVAIAWVIFRLVRSAWRELQKWSSISDHRDDNV